MLHGELHSDEVRAKSLLQQKTPVKYDLFGFLFHFIFVTFPFKWVDLHCMCVRVEVFVYACDCGNHAVRHTFYIRQ